MSRHTHLFTSLSAVAAAAALAAGAWAAGPSDQGSSSPQGQSSGQSYQGQNPGQNSGQSGQSSGQYGQAQGGPQGFVLVEDQTVYLMANEPQNHFIQAATDLRQNDSSKAAAEINIAASYIDSLSSSPGQHQANPSQQANQGQQANPSQQASRLSQCAQQLRQDAKQVRNGQIHNINQLSQDFAKTNADLAAFFQSKADQSLQNGHKVRAGYQLDNAVSSFRAALAWSNQNVNQKDTQVIDNASWTASQLLGPENQQAMANSRTPNESNQNQAASSNQSPQQATQALAMQIQQLQSKLNQGSQNQGSQNQGSQNQGTQ